MSRSETGALAVAGLGLHPSVIAGSVTLDKLFHFCLGLLIFKTGTLPICEILGELKDQRFHFVGIGEVSVPSLLVNLPQSSP